jgi:hypothetical protein
MPMLLKFFPKTEKWRTLPNSFNETSITLTSKTDNNPTKKKKL